jgi:hypothetical protein
VLVVVLAVGVACVSDSPSDSGVTQVTSVAGATTPAPTPVPTSVPTAAPTANPISYVRVAFFGVNCKGGGAPDNAQRKLPVGCSGDVTATPKKEDGTDVHSNDHGTEITWELMHGERLISIYDVPGQPFNKHLIGRIAGPFMLCATVSGVMGCLTAEVTP